MQAAAYMVRINERTSTALHELRRTYFPNADLLSNSIAVSKQFTDANCKITISLSLELLAVAVREGSCATLAPHHIVYPRTNARYMLSVHMFSMHKAHACL